MHSQHISGSVIKRRHDKQRSVQVLFFTIKAPQLIFYGALPRGSICVRKGLCSSFSTQNVHQPTHSKTHSTHRKTHTLRMHAGVAALSGWVSHICPLSSLLCQHSYIPIGCNHWWPWQPAWQAVTHRPPFLNCAHSSTDGGKLSLQVDGKVALLYFRVAHTYSHSVSLSHLRAYTDPHTYMCTAGVEETITSSGSISGITLTLAAKANSWPLSKVASWVLACTRMCVRLWESSRLQHGMLRTAVDTSERIYTETWPHASLSLFSSPLPPISLWRICAKVWQ